MKEPHTALFVAPTGVGKSHLALSLLENEYRNPLIKSQYTLSIYYSLRKYTYFILMLYYKYTLSILNVYFKYYPSTS